MNKNLVFSAQFLILVVVMLYWSPSYAYDSSSKLVTCNCQTDEDFKAFAKAATGKSVGSFKFLVTNDSIRKTFDINITSEYDRETRRYFYFVTYFVELTRNEEENFSRLYRIYSGQTPIFADAKSLALTGAEYSGFRLSTPESICGVLTSTPAFIQAFGQNASGGPVSIFAKLLNQLYGRGPIGTFVFFNGDVAQYYVYPLEGDVVSRCRYVPGSARDALGYFINDQGLGGTGVGNGSNYVRTGGPGRFDILNSNSEVWRFCAYQLNSNGSRTLLGCYIKAF